jgi:hypothetical protein
MTFFETIWTEMCKGNFSFAILIMGGLQLVAAVIQIAIMLKNRRK